MKSKANIAEKPIVEEETLYQQFSQLKPQFATKEAARSSYLKELEAIAARYNSTVENLISFIDKKNIWSEEDRHFMRLSRLVSALR